MRIVLNSLSACLFIYLFIVFFCFFFSTVLNNEYETSLKVLFLCNLEVLLHGPLMSVDKPILL